MLDKRALIICVIRTGSIFAAARKVDVLVSAGIGGGKNEKKIGDVLYRRDNRLLSAYQATNAFTTTLTGSKIRR
ncbi:hypothetical protein L3V77_19300 [Vibrio sp. DW001]|uniref:hypothetical protein n=1 Tax=Vibrio sp. DW001 TaxID=2912315 RepID=UPI0023AEC799|nr:hypothetical protein [Vibrio sp. DW001]WED29569.1 hypothetical protein L3V77_19300 [Vibrio sp. DW001]